MSLLLESDSIELIYIENLLDRQIDKQDMVCSCRDIHYWIGKIKHRSISFNVLKDVCDFYHNSDRKENAVTC